MYFALFSADDQAAFFSPDFVQYYILSFNIIETLVSFINPFVNAISPVFPPTILLKVLMHSAVHLLTR